VLGVVVARVVPFESSLPVSFSPFCQMAFEPLEQLSAGRQYVSLAGMLQICAYLYETGAVAGRARPKELRRLLKSLVDKDNEDCALPNLKWALRMRLEKTSRECRSLYTFYLYRTMRRMSLDFSVAGMNEAHGEPRLLGEVWPHLDLAGAEGLVMGASFPELTRHLYNKDFDARHEVICLLKARGVVAPDETEERDIEHRASTVGRKLSALAGLVGTQGTRHGAL